jgi:integrase
MERAIEAWGQTNIRQIGFAEIEDLILSQPMSGKSQANMGACLHAFWTWLRKRGVLKLHEVPEFPDIPYELGFRKTVDKATQQAIIDEAYRISYHVNPKIWLGIKWLSTYISVRPGELLKVKEEDIDLVGGFLLIRFPKEKKPKTVPLLEEDVELLKAMPRGLPHLPFFRHNPSYGSVEGKAFGEKYFYKWWKRACAKLGIEGVDLYGGTRHSSARALRVEQNRTPEEIKRATMHSTNKAFDRYFDFESDDIRAIYADTAKRGRSKIDTPLTPQKPPTEESQFIDFKRK